LRDQKEKGLPDPVSRVRSARRRIDASIVIVNKVGLICDQLEVTANLGESTTLKVRVTNTGKKHGVETVQMYIRNLVSSAIRPVRELKGFAKISLGPEETQTIELPIGPDSLAFWNIDKKFAVEPG
jgi:beta-glucosidase